MLSWGAPTLPRSPHVHQPRNSPNPPFSIFIAASSCRHDSSYHWPLVTELSLQSLFPPQRLGGWKPQPSNHAISHPGNQPHSKVISKSHLINIEQILKVLGALCQEDKIYISFKKKKIDCVLLFIFLTLPRRLWDLSSPARYWTQALSVRAPDLNHWTARKFPHISYYNSQSHTVPLRSWKFSFCPFAHPNQPFCHPVRRQRSKCHDQICI